MWFCVIFIYLNWTVYRLVVGDGSDAHPFCISMTSTAMLNTVSKLHSWVAPWVMGESGATLSMSKLLSLTEVCSLLCDFRVTELDKKLLLLHSFSNAQRELRPQVVESKLASEDAWLLSIKKHNGSVPPKSSLLSPIFVTRNFQTCAVTLLFKWGIHNCRGTRHHTVLTLMTVRLPTLKHRLLWDIFVRSCTSEKGSS